MVPVIAGFGNPLLDILVKIDNNDLITKYNLNEDDSKEISYDQMKALLTDIQNFEYKYNPGGCSQNTLRILQCILNQENSTVMFGAIGNDANGKLLEDSVESSGVQTRYTHKNDKLTGTIIALIKGLTRSLVGNIGASGDYSIEDLKTPNNLDILKSIHFVYVEGFFLTNRISLTKYVLNFCKENNKRFVFNISAPYLCQNISDDMIYFAQNCDILFGNRKEFQSLCNAMKTYDSINTLTKDLCKSYENKSDFLYGKIIVITNGADNVICHHSIDTTECLQIPKIDTSKIADTTGAGDSFVSGFLAGMLNNLTPLTCLKWGCWVSQQVIKEIGCNISNVDKNALYDIE